jgi:hypothetical protein
MENSFKKEIWEEDSFTLDDSRDISPSMVVASVHIEPSNEEIKEELKAQEVQ